MDISSPIGSIAAICTTGAFLPQIWKIKRQGGADLSYLMLSVYLLGIILWLIYGILLHAGAVIWANAATAVLVAIAMGLKAVKSRENQMRKPTKPSVASVPSYSND